MHSTPILVPLVTVIFAALICGWLLDRLNQPAIVGYILAGVFLGPQLLGLVHNEEAFDLLGQMGLMFLLFFIGSEVRIGKLLANWRISIGGTFLHIFINVGICYGLGYFLNWSINQVVFIGFVTSLSSTAVVLKILEDADGLKSRVGRNCVGILLVQDFAVVPMLIILSLMSDETSSADLIGRQFVGFLGIVGIILFLVRKKQYRLPIWFIAKNTEFKVLVGLLFCLGAASITGVLGLSAELGSFVAGLVIGQSRQGASIKEYIQPFKIFFLSIFFVSIGLLFDLHFFQENLFAILCLVLLVLVLNSIIHAAILKIIGVPTQIAFMTSILLSQIGEFSFILASVAGEKNIIEDYGYQMTISVIVFTLFLTPLWVQFSRKIFKYGTGSSETVKFSSLES